MPSSRRADAPFAVVVPFLDDGRAWRRTALWATVASLLRQTDENWRCYLVDDGSPAPRRPRARTDRPPSPRSEPATDPPRPGDTRVVLGARLGLDPVEARDLVSENRDQTDHVFDPLPHADRVRS